MHNPILSPTLSTQPQRKKTSRSRTTTGCLTCKIRRIKCDEKEPSCSQCLRGRRKCDGYPSKMLQVIIVAPSLSIGLFKNKKERRSFEFFQRRTIPQLAGFFKSQFWERLLLQALHHEPAVQHASVALGALHENFECSSSSTENKRGFAIEQYLRALRLVTKPAQNDGRPAADVALMSCALFVCFEILQGNYGAALSHIDGGVKIVSELQSRDNPLHLSSVPYVPLPLLEQIFSDLDTSASQIAAKRPRQLFRRDWSEHQSGPEVEIPPKFSSLEAARRGLDDIEACVEHMARSLPQPPPLNLTDGSAEVKLSLDLIRNFARVSLQQWTRAFDSLIVDKSKFTKAELITTNLLQLQRAQSEITFAVSFDHSSNEMSWDQHLDKFEEVILYAEEFLQSLCMNEYPPSFTLDQEVIMPLFITAGKCRDSRIRRKAIALLKSINKQEGILNSLATAGIMERILEIEEEGLDGAMVSSASIPLHHRVLGVECRFDPAINMAMLRFVKMKEGGGTENIDEWIDSSKPGAICDPEYFETGYHPSPFSYET